MLINGLSGCIPGVGAAIPYGAPGCLNLVCIEPEHYRVTEEWVEELIRIIVEKENCSRDD